MFYVQCIAMFHNRVAYSNIFVTIYVKELTIYVNDVHIQVFLALWECSQYRDLST